MLYDTMGIAYDNVSHYKDIMRFIRGSITGDSGQEGGGPWQPLWDLIRKFSLPNKFLNFSSNEFK